MTTSAPLPADGPERAIFLAALRAYSESCKPPDLTADCPFSVTTPTGRGCGEECMDLLAMHGSPPTVDEVDLGRGVAISPRRRRRSRRGPEPNTRPFDAAELYLLDQDEKDWRRWRSSSLLHEAQDAVGSSPTRDPVTAEARLQRLTACLDELERRGFDVDLVTREGLGLDIVSGVIATTAMPALVVSKDPDVDRRILSAIEAPAAWQELFDTTVEKDESPRLNVDNVHLRRLLIATNGGFSQGVKAWVDHAPLDDLLRWRAPSLENFDTSGAPFDPTSAFRGPHRWIVDRFLRTYIHDWDVSSLHMEWQYMHAERIAPCNSREMSARRIDEIEVAKAIADRAVSEGAGVRRGVDTIALSTYRQVAIKYLEEGNSVSAAAIFEAAREVAPDNAELHNNYGFCLLPSDPRAALVALKRAAELGHDGDAVNVGNRMYALFALGRLTAALELADRFLSGPTMPIGGGWMWGYEEDLSDPPLISVDDTREYVAGLARFIAEQAR